MPTTFSIVQPTKHTFPTLLRLPWHTRCVTKTNYEQSITNPLLCEFYCNNIHVLITLINQMTLSCENESYANCAVWQGATQSALVTQAFCGLIMMRVILLLLCYAILLITTIEENATGKKKGK